MGGGLSCPLRHSAPSAPTVHLGPGLALQGLALLLGHQVADGPGYSLACHETYASGEKLTTGEHGASPGEHEGRAHQGEEP
jgi:hypothetical protein